MRKALVVGSAGQDGTLLSAQLAERGYDVVGVGKSRERGIEDATEVERLVTSHHPDEIYFLAAYHHSSEDPVIESGELFSRSVAVHATALVHFLETIRRHSMQTRLFYAASSLIFGEVSESPQTEATPVRPTCAYGITKTTGMRICQYYRRNHDIHASVGILYNHESPLRADKFLSKKVVKAAWQIKRGERDMLVLGDLSAQIDWGYAPDFVDAMRRIVALDKPDDFIVATGESHSVRDFVELAFGHVGVDWTKHVEENRALITRPPTVRVGNASKLTAATGWRPTTSFPAMVRALMDAEREAH